MSNAIMATVQAAHFAVEQLLTPQSKVYFENIFSTRHIGRVVDFMLFEGRGFIASTSDPGLAEYRFRQIIQLAIFNAWSNYRPGEKSKCVELEFGWDKSLMVLAVSHYAEPGVAGFVPGSGTPANAASERISKMLAQIQQLADGLIVRHDPSSGRMQVVAYLSGASEDKLPAPEYLDVTKLSEAPGPDQNTTAPEALSAGDLAAFTADESASPPASVSEPEEVHIEAAKTEEEAVTRVTGGNIEEEKTERVISGDVAEKEKVTIIKGKAETIKTDDTKFVFKSEKPQEDRGYNFVTKAGLGEAAPSDDDGEESAEVLKFKNEVETGALPAGVRDMAQNALRAVTQERAELRQKARAVDGLLKKREYEFKTKELALTEQIRTVEGSLRQKEVALERAKETIGNLSATFEHMKAANSDAKDKLEAVHKLVTTEKLLAAEKANAERMKTRIEDMQKKLNEESAARGAALQEAGKQKKLVDELHRKMAQLQEAAKGGAAIEIKSLAEQRDKSQRLADELKRQIHELQSKLATMTTANKSAAAANQGAKAGSTQSEAELKHKLEMMDRMNKASKDELEKSKKRFEEVKANETKLRQEISKLQTDLAKAQADIKAAGIRSAGATVAAGKLGKK